MSKKVITSISQIIQCYVFFRYTLAGIQVNSRFQVYTTQDTTALVTVFLQVKGVFRNTAGLINVFLIYKLTVVFMYTLPRIVQVNTMQRG